MKRFTILPAFLIAATTLSSPLFAQCESTLFASDNGLSAAGATMYVDVTAAAPVTIGSIEINTSAAIGTSVGIEIWTTATTYVGNELDASVWTQVAFDDGMAASAGLDAPTPITLATAFSLPAGTTGVALVGVNTGHRYTNGTGTNQTYVGTYLTIEGGSSTGAAFGGSLFNPRMFNGSFCVGSSGAGTAFCTSMPSNSTGVPTSLSGDMSAPGGTGLHLEATSGPAGEFGYFLVGTGAADPGVAVGNGFFCLDVSGNNFYAGYKIQGGDQNSIGQFDSSGVLQNLASTSTTGTGFDVPFAVPASGSPMITVGSTWHFQVWHRDTPSAVGASNLSNGLSVTF